MGEESPQNVDPVIAKQLQFVAWLESEGIYNPFESANTMRRMQAVWEHAGAPVAIQRQHYVKPVVNRPRS